jgi:stage II sporulation protein M
MVRISMVREEDYGMLGEGEVVQIETLDERIGNRRCTGKEKDSYIAKMEANIYQVGKNNSKKDDFIGYMNSLWPYLVIIIFVFFGSLLMGYASAASFPHMADNLMKEFSSRFAPLRTMSPIYILIAIFLNNTFVSLVSLVLGIAVGIFPILFIASNGYFIGMVSYLVSQQKGFIFILLALLPHGVVELPTIFLSASIGLRLGHHMFLSLTGRPTEVRGEIKKGLKFYFSLIMPFLFIAAIIETFITPLILGFI